MTSQEQNLSVQQTELVAVGASVGAGCRPCVSHHLTAGAQAGLDSGQLLAAVASAERIAAEAAVAMGDHARAKLSASVSSPALLSRLEEAFASLGAALGANDATNIERQLRAVADLGVTRAQLEQAIETAHTVQENAADIHRRKAERLLDALAPATAAARTEAGSGSGCGCGTSDEIEEAPLTAGEPESTTAVSGDQPRKGCGSGADHETEEAPVTAAKPAATTSGRAAGCSGMATRFASSDSSGAIAGCSAVFERFVAAASTAETDEAPAATTATGACQKEA